MDLLPKNEVDFSTVDYWNKFFKERGNKAFEWYGEYPELCGELHRYIKPKDNILVVGCGNSKLSSDLFDVGCRQMINIDVSSVVIKQMQNHFKRDKPEMIFREMDALNMTFEKETFTVVLDKGTLDALMPNDTQEDIERGRRLFNEVFKVLKNGGRYIIISLLQKHILKAILDYFTDAGWMIRISRCHDVERKSLDETGKFGFPVFFIVCTKFKKMNNSEPILEVNLFIDGKIQRIKSTDEVMNIIEGVQKSALCCKTADDEVIVEFCKDNESKPRYTIYIADKCRDPKELNKYAAFIVPLGRETEWLFCTKDGRSYLRESSGFDRLAIVCLHRDQYYSQMEEIQNEIRQTILQFTPLSVAVKNSGPQIPYLTLGDGIGRRETLFRTNSDLSGDLAVEEVTIDGEIYRRLIFLNNQAVVQSEVRLKKEPSKKNRKGKSVIDSDFTASGHVSYMAIAPALINKQEVAILVVGVGGGGLCMLLRELFPSATITGLEIDPLVVKLAEDYFGLKTDERLNVVIEDGVKFIKLEKQFDLVIFDVDSKIQGLEISSPPPEFTETSVLNSVKNMISDNGIFVTNVVSRMEKSHQEIVKKLKNHFALISCYNLKEDVNRIVFASNMKDVDSDQWQERIKTNANLVNQIAKQKLKKSESIIDLIHLMSELKTF